MGQKYPHRWNIARLRLRSKWVTLVALYLQCWDHEGEVPHISTDILCEIAVAVKAAGYPFIVGGDWNLDNEQLATWSDSQNLSNYIYANATNKYHTRQSGNSATCIDHILHNQATTISSGSINYATLGKSDLYPIINTIKLSEPLHNMKITQTHGKLKPIRRVELSRKNRVAINNINDTLLKHYPQTELNELDAMETGLLLEQIVRTTVQAAKTNMPRTPCPNKKFMMAGHPLTVSTSTN
jgi:hypothetical protein